MDEAALYTQTKTFLLALAWSQVRIVALFTPIPIFNRNLLPGMLRLAVAAALGLVVVPTLMPQVAALDLGASQAILLMAKEAFVGFLLGCLIAVPFWAFEAVGFLIDNQRGASISATLNPLTGNDSSPLGILFNQAFIVFFFVSGGFLMLLDMLYSSFQLWNVFTWAPQLRPETMPVLIAQVMGLVKVGLLLSAPAVIAMFLAEMGLALVSRFVPQLQVFFLAMPIKSALAVLVLMLYMSTLFEYTSQQLQQLRGVLPMLQQHLGR